MGQEVRVQWDQGVEEFEGCLLVGLSDGKLSVEVPCHGENTDLAMPRFSTSEASTHPSLHAASTARFIAAEAISSSCDNIARIWLSSRGRGLSSAWSPI